MSIFCASGRKMRISKISPTRFGPKIRKGSECFPARKLLNSSGGKPAIWKGFMVEIGKIDRNRPGGCTVSSLQPFIGSINHFDCFCHFVGSTEFSTHQWGEGTQS